MENILRAYEIATAEQRQAGLEWYAWARDWSDRVALKYNKTRLQVVQMIAVMSPRNRWEWNLGDVIRILDTEAEGGDGMQARCHSFDRNKAKAVAACRGQGIGTPGPKVAAFIDNIYDPESKRITVDVWAWRVYLGDYKLTPDRITPKMYAHIEKQYLEAADLLDLRGYELQAIVWSVARDSGPQFNEQAPDID
jgi:hypothetical protein